MTLIYKTRKRFKLGALPPISIDKIKAFICAFNHSCLWCPWSQVAAEWHFLSLYQRGSSVFSFYSFRKRKKKAIETQGASEPMSSAKVGEHFKQHKSQRLHLLFTLVIQPPARHTLCCLAKTRAVVGRHWSAQLSIVRTRTDAEMKNIHEHKQNQPSSQSFFLAMFPYRSLQQICCLSQLRCKPSAGKFL